MSEWATQIAGSKKSRKSRRLAEIQRAQEPEPKPAAKPKPEPKPAAKPKRSKAKGS